MPSIEYIRSFITIADLKSFTNAANILFLTQPAISAQIKSLERSVGFPLIERNDKRVQITEAGKHFYREAKKILMVHDRVIGLMNDFKGLHRGKLNLGASTIPGEYLMPKLIGEFRKCYPEIKYSLRVGNTSQILDLLYDRKIDLGVVGAKIESTHVEFIPFIQDELVLIASTHSNIQDTINIRDLLSIEMIMREPGSGTRIAVKEFLSEQDIKEADLNIMMELGSTQALITGVAENLGIAFVSKWAAENSLKAGTIKQVAVQGIRLRRDLYIIVIANSSVNIARDIFLQHLIKEQGEEVNKGKKWMHKYGTIIWQK